MAWDKMSEEAQDYFLAEWILDGYENGESKNEYAWTLSAVQKIFPRIKLRTAWKVLDVWTTLVPVQQAPAAPPELVQAMITLSTLLNRPQLGLVILLCFVGLLRVREALNLRWNDVVLQQDYIVLCLGLTKRGMEQKVVLNNPTVVLFVGHYLQRFPCKQTDGYIFSISYSSTLRWVRKLSEVLGAGDLGLTTHSFRRSGASELARQNMPLSDILLYGRWASEKSAKEYIRKGEVAIFRARQFLEGKGHHRIQAWANLGNNVWQWFDFFYTESNLDINMNRLTMEKLVKLEGILFSF